MNVQKQHLRALHLAQNVLLDFYRCTNYTTIEKFGVCKILFYEIFFLTLIQTTFISSSKQ